MESDSSVICSDSSVGKLRELLKLESKSHRDTGRCYDTLQQEYDDLLRKYAEAENTIDRLRIDLLRERISEKNGELSTIDIAINNVNAWQRLYDDLAVRSNKLKNNVCSFHEYLVSHETVGNEMNTIFDRLNLDFENILNAFQSVQSLHNKVDIPAEKETSIAADDLEGNLYRLGLRLSEIQEEMNNKCRKFGDLSNSLSNAKKFDIYLENKGYDAECSEAETVREEDELMIDSDVNDNYPLDPERPCTDDLSEMISYKKMNDEFKCLNPDMYRCISEPKNLHKQLENNAHFEDEMEESEDEENFGSFDATVINVFDSKDSDTKGRLSSVKEYPSRGTLNPTPDDSGYQESNHSILSLMKLKKPLHSSPVDADKINMPALFQQQNSTDADGIAEEYSKKLDSLRGYILGKQAAINSSSLSDLETSETLYPSTSRNKRRANRNSASPVNKNLPSSSQFGSTLLSPDRSDSSNDTVVRNNRTLDSSANELKALRNEMRGVQDMIRDLKDTIRNQNAASLMCDRRASDISRDNNDDDVDGDVNNPDDSLVPENEMTQLLDLQAKQFKTLEKLEKRMGDIADDIKGIQSTEKNCRPPSASPINLPLHIPATQNQHNIVQANRSLSRTPNCRNRSTHDAQNSLNNSFNDPHKLSTKSPFVKTHDYENSLLNESIHAKRDLQNEFDVGQDNSAMPNLKSPDLNEGGDESYYDEQNLDKNRASRMNGTLNSIGAKLDTLSSFLQNKGSKKESTESPEDRQMKLLEKLENKLENLCNNMNATSSANSTANRNQPLSMSTSTPMNSTTPLKNPPPPLHVNDSTTFDTSSHTNNATPFENPSHSNDCTYVRSPSTANKSRLKGNENARQSFIPQNETTTSTNTANQVVHHYHHTVDPSASGLHGLPNHQSAARVQTASTNKHTRTHIPTNHLHSTNSQLKNTTQPMRQSVIENYLEKANSSAILVESLSKKLLHTMGSDLLYSSPSEF